MSKIPLWFNFKAREQPSKYPNIPHKGNLISKRTTPQGSLGAHTICLYVAFTKGDLQRAFPLSK